MTVTLNLDPALLARARTHAARDGRTVEQLIEQLITQQLGRVNGATAAGEQAGAAPSRNTVKQHAFPPLPVFDGGGFPPEIDQRSNASLLAAAEAEEDERYMRIARGEQPEP